MTTKTITTIETVQNTTGNNSIIDSYPPPPPPPRKYNLSLKPTGFSWAKGFYLIAGTFAILFFTACQCQTSVEPSSVIPPLIVNQNFEVMENVPIGTIVGMVNTTDNDRISNYAITAGNTNNAFAISNNGALTTANIIDYETISNYDLIIQITDKGGNTATNTTTVEVIDLDEEAPTISNHSFTIIENISTGEVVGMVSATDNDRITNYTIITGNTSNAFAISNNGALTTANTIDYEIVSNYSLTIEVTDGGGNTATNTITVAVIDLDEQAPSVTNHFFTVMENAPTSTVVGLVNATDNDRITNYAIAAGNTGDAFAISNNGLLTTANTIDYESTSNYNLVVEVTDGAGNTASNVVTINVVLVPKVTTLNPSGVQAVDAVLKGNITNLGVSTDGSRQVSAYGFIYSTNASNQNSLTLGAGGVEKTNLGSINTIGEFSNRVTGLAESTTYYYRAYVGNNVGTNFGEVRSFTTGILNKTFSLSGADDGEQSGVIYPGGTHTYNLPLSHERAYNLAVNADSNLLDNLAIYQNTNTNQLYTRSGPFSMTLAGLVNPLTNDIPGVTITFSGTNSGRRYLVLPLFSTNHRLVISNGNMGTESYTLKLGEETNTSGQLTSRLLIDETPTGFFTNNEPLFYWMHMPPNRSFLDVNVVDFLPGVITCGVSGNGDEEFPVSANTYYQLGGAFSGYTMIRIIDNDTDQHKCQYSFRTR